MGKNDEKITSRHFKENHTRLNAEILDIQNLCYKTEHCANNKNVINFPEQN